MALNLKEINDRCLASKQPDSELAQERKSGNNHKHRHGSTHQAPGEPVSAVGVKWKAGCTSPCVAHVV